MIITTSDGKYKLKYEKKKVRWWDYEIIIYLIPLNPSYWPKYVGYIGKFERTSYRPHPTPWASLYKDFSELTAPNLKELKKLVEARLKELYN